MTSATLAASLLPLALLLRAPPPTLQPAPPQPLCAPFAWPQLPLPCASGAVPLHVRRCAPPTAVLAESTFDFEFVDDDEEEELEADDPMEEMENALSDQPAANMTVSELQAQLKQLGQRHTGTKKDLIERVQLMQRKKALGLPIHDMQVKRTEDMRWYMLQTANGFERAVERTITMMIKAQRLESKIERVWVPILEGETSVRENSVMPSYIFIRMRMSAALHFLISDMQYVINFVGADRGGRSTSGQMVGNRGFVRPMPLTDEAFLKIVQLTKVKAPQHAAADGADGADAPPEPAFKLDDIVEVSEGPFKGMQGPIVAVADSGAELTLALTVMGRDTPVTLPVEHCVGLDQAL